MSLEEAVQSIDRDYCIAHNTDALGKRWVIKHIKHTTLYVARPENDREDAVIPTEFRGKWTNPQRLQERIDLYLERSWNKAEKAQQKTARKAESIDVGLTNERSLEADAAVDAFIKETVQEKDAGDSETEGSISSE
mgnify:CR=1 FL=1